MNSMQIAFDANEIIESTDEDEQPCRSVVYVSFSCHFCEAVIGMNAKCKMNITKQTVVAASAAAAKINEKWVHFYIIIIIVVRRHQKCP